MANNAQQPIKPIVVEIDENCSVESVIEGFLKPLGDQILSEGIGSSGLNLVRNLVRSCELIVYRVEVVCSVQQSDEAE